MDVVVEVDVTLYWIAETSSTYINSNNVEAMPYFWMYLCDTCKHVCEAIARSAAGSTRVVEEISNTTLQGHQFPRLMICARYRDIPEDLEQEV